MNADKSEGLFILAKYPSQHSAMNGVRSQNEQSLSAKFHDVQDETKQDSSFVAQFLSKTAPEILPHEYKEG